MTQNFNESTVEEAALSWFEGLGYERRHGSEIAPGEPQAERQSYDAVLLSGRFHQSVFQINPSIPQEALEEAIRKVEKWSAPDVVQANRQIHQWMANGVEVEYLPLELAVALGQFADLDIDSRTEQLHSPL